jgi:capsid protein
MNQLLSYIYNSALIQGDKVADMNPTFDGSLEEYGDYARRSRKQINYHSLNGVDIPSILEASVAGVIGSGVNIQCRTGIKAIDESFEEFLELHSEPNNFDIKKDDSRNEMFRHIQRFATQNGGVLIRFRYSLRWKIPFKIELIGVDMIDTSKDNYFTNTLNGLQKDKDGAITGIWIYNDYKKTSSRLVSMTDMVFYRRKWMSLSQYTATSKLAVILPMLEKALAYSQAELDMAIEKAKAGSYWHTELYDTVTDALQSEMKKMSNEGASLPAKLKIVDDTIKKIASRGIQPKGLTAIPKDDTITTINSKPDSQYETFTNETQKSMAAAVGSSQVSAYKDPSKSNYAGLQYTGASDEETFKMDFDYMVSKLIKEYCKRLFAIAVQIKAIPLSKEKYLKNPEKYHKFDIWRQSKKVTDPDKKAKANERNLKTGADTLSAIYAEQGRDYIAEKKKEVLAQLELEQWEKDEREKRGLAIEIIESETTQNSKDTKK